ncbi:condensation domain-containing protein [Streptomyces pini]|nr:condensation domain-containing protein [Streptomyces pini]
MRENAMAWTERRLTGELLEILATHLAGQEIRPDDDFYAMGGDSLVALRVVADAQARGLPMTLQDILFHPTAAELAAELAGRDPADAEEAEGAAAPGHSPAAAGPFGLVTEADREALPDGLDDAVPATALQIGLLYVSQLSADSTLYQDLVGVEVSGRFDDALFRDALAALCRRHTVLRSSFDLGTFGEPLQLVWSDPGLSLTVDTVATQDPGDDAKTVGLMEDWKRRRLAEPPDTGRAPAFRCHVVARPKSFHVMLALHHAFVDGWSYAQLLVDLMVLYDAALSGTEPALPPVPGSGARIFAELERAALDSAEAERFWREEADVPPLRFDRGRFDAAPDQSAHAAFDIDTDLLARLRRAARQAGVPLRSLVLAAHAWSLGRWADRERDVVTGVVVNGRPEIIGSDLMVGLFLNTVPMRFPGLTGSWADLARHALLSEQRALPHRRYPLGRIEQLIGRPPFDVAFNFTHFHVYRRLDELREIRPGTWWAYDKNSFPVVVDFAIEAPEAGTGVTYSYAPALAGEEEIRRLAGLYRAALRAAAEDPDREADDTADLAEGR